MAGFLKMDEEQDGDQAANMQAVGRGVEAYIARCHFFFQLFFGSGHDILDHPSPAEFFDQIHFKPVI